MRTRLFGLKRRIAAAIFLGLLAGTLFFLQAGRFLVADDPFEHAQMALVLSGEAIPRSLAARDLYQEGRIDQILIIPEPPNPFQDEMVKLGLSESGEHSPISERIFRASGIPREKILFLPEPADGTIQEALQARRFLKGRLPAKLVLVTSKASCRRAKFIFCRIFRNEKVEILIHPSPYDPFIADRWWSHPRNALRVVTEYQKFLANALTLFLGLHSEARSLSPAEEMRTVSKNG